jgi:hypothetical protein
MEVNHPHGQITFPNPSANWGTITHAFLSFSNPSRRWWQLWKPRYLHMWAPIRAVNMNHDVAIDFSEVKLTID